MLMNNNVILKLIGDDSELNKKTKFTIFNSVVKLCSKVKKEKMKKKNSKKIKIGVLGANSGARSGSRSK